MKLYAESIFNHIRQQIDIHQGKKGSSRKLLFVMPAVPLAVAALLGTQLNNLAAQARKGVHFLYKIAQPLAEEWLNLSNSTDQQHRNNIANNGWVDNQGNLTNYRNAPVPDGISIQVVILVGSDRITDQSSLEDFYHCSSQVLWQLEIKQNFTQWIENTLNEAKIIYEPENLANINMVLLALVEKGLADILSISMLLETLDLRVAADGRDVEKILLGSLQSFGVPRLTGYRFGGRNKLTGYINDGVAFFSWDIFLDAVNRKKNIAKIEKFQKDKSGEVPELFDLHGKGDFTDGCEILRSVISFIDTADSPLRERLMDCDFITLRDKVLKYRPPRESPEKHQKPKLTGSPIEVILTAIWRTLKSYKTTCDDLGEIAHESITKIQVIAGVFKHDQEGDSAEKRTEEATDYITRLLGGVDKWLKGNIDSEVFLNKGRSLEIEIDLTPKSYQPCRTAEPSLEFETLIYGLNPKDPVRECFQWRLPELDHYRLADDLLMWASEKLKKNNDFCLPVFLVQHYEELLLSHDDEDTRRILKYAISKGGVCNLLPDFRFINQDESWQGLQRLAYSYQQFILAVKNNGLHYALLQNEWIDLRQSYQNATDNCLQQPQCWDSPVSAIQHRAFLVLRDRKSGDSQEWRYTPFEPSGIVTVLHPALLEMIVAQFQFLMTSFSVIAGRELKSTGSRCFQNKVWQRYVDLAQLKLPLNGLIKNQDGILETQIRGSQMIHRIGSPVHDNSSLTTRLMQRYDDFSEDEISLEDIVRESRESLLITRIMEDYRRLHPHAEDGLSIAVFRNQDIQPVVAAIHTYLRTWHETHPDARVPYGLSITFFSDSGDGVGIDRWVSQWQERWESAESETTSLAHYRSCRLTIANRILPPENKHQQFSQLIAAGLAVDIAFLDNFIHAGQSGNQFQPVDSFDFASRWLKFPVLEKPVCAVNQLGKDRLRQRVISNRQFLLAGCHSEIMARIKSRQSETGVHHVILGIGDYEPWQQVVDEFHRHAEWVVCIDPNMDERLIAMKETETGGPRQIIGFGSGVGNYGESNYTISTELYQWSDVKNRLSASIAELFVGWKSSEYPVAAAVILAESRRLSGLSLVRATGRGEYIRDFLAYTMTRKLLLANGSQLCDQLISLDAYRHWFDTAESDVRPDLMWLVVHLMPEGNLELEIRLIECKIAQQSLEHREKAREQLKSGLDHLMAMFMPAVGSNRSKRPDERYWWLQLYRLIASKTEINPVEQQPVLTALERLADGDYVVHWHAAMFAFWVDSDSLEPVSTPTWPIVCADNQTLIISVVEMGQPFVRRICLEENGSSEIWTGKHVSYRPDSIQFPNHEENEQEEYLEQKKEQQVPVEVTGETQSTHIKRVPERILLGKASNSEIPVYWEFGHRDLNNRHMLIFGSSGMGKTYGIQCLLHELSLLGQNSLILDYTDGFLPEQMEPVIQTNLKPKQHVVRETPLPISPFRLQQSVIAGKIILEKAASAAKRIASIFQTVYELGDQQFSALFDAITDGIIANGEKMSLDQMLQTLQDYIDDSSKNKSAVQTTLSKIKPFVMEEPFGGDSLNWSDLFTDTRSRCHIFQLATMDNHTRRLIVEFTLWDLYAFLQSQGSKDNPKVLVLDEIQNLDHKDNGPLSKFLREGRKFGIAMIMATQIMSNLQKDERDRLFNAAHKLFFKPADTEVKIYADILANSTGDKVEVWIKRMTGLRKGECYSLGPSFHEGSGQLNVKAYKINITSLEERLVQ